MSQSRGQRTTLLECIHSLEQLIEEKHAKCIADRADSSAAAAAAAAQKESLQATVLAQPFFGTMMDAAAAHATSERRAAELLAARELVKSWKRAATAAEEHAEAARRAEVEAATLAAAAAAARTQARAAGVIFGHRLTVYPASTRISLALGCGAQPTRYAYMVVGGCFSHAKGQYPPLNLIFLPAALVSADLLPCATGGFRGLKSS